jgi:hypothetical protein
MLPSLAEGTLAPQDLHRGMEHMPQRQPSSGIEEGPLQQRAGDQDGLTNLSVDTQANGVKAVVGE